MIKRLIHICLIISALTGILVGCNGVPDYDTRLVTADSLMSNLKQREIALNQLDSISPNTLNTEADRAYYDLLITQARYLNYVPFINDSCINKAVRYYESNGHDIEKLARAYIYKGAVLDVLGKPDSAMLFYKNAEAVTADDDYFNRGYALLRMGKLYSNHYAYDGRDIEKLEQALECFKKSQNAYYQMICLNDLGALYRSSDKQRAEVTLENAIKMATQLKDTVNIIRTTHNLAYLYFMMGVKDKRYNRLAYNQLQKIKALRLSDLGDGVYATFASVYATIGKPDSAMWFLGLAQQGVERDSTYYNSNNYLEPMSKIKGALGDSINYYKLSYKCDRNSFALLQNPQIMKIMYAELKFDEQQKTKAEQAQRNKLILLAFVIGALLLLALLLYRRTHRYDKLVMELKDQSHNQMQDLTDMQQSISELQINDERLKGFISSHMGMMREMIEACYHEPNNRIAENMKRIVKFQDSNKDNWVKLYDYIDLEHNYIMTRTRERYPELNDRELLLLALTCMGFSYIQIAIIMGYSNATSVSVIKQRLVKKMGLDCSLNEYIQNNDNMKK